jgi:hypothetical protein
MRKTAKNARKGKSFYKSGNFRDGLLVSGLKIWWSGEGRMLKHSVFSPDNEMTL